MAARKKNAEAAREAADGGGGDDDTNMMPDEDSNDQNDSISAADTSVGASAPKKLKMEMEEEESFDLKKGIMGIDQSILQSIDKCGTYRPASHEQRTHNNPV